MRSSRTERSNIVGFDELIPVRIKRSDKHAIEHILRVDFEDRYGSISHFIRCAVRRQIKIDNERLKK